MTPPKPIKYFTSHLSLDEFLKPDIDFDIEQITIIIACTDNSGEWWDEECCGLYDVLEKAVERGQSNYNVFKIDGDTITQIGKISTIFVATELKTKEFPDVDIP
jgi:hypothetical protein